MTSAGSTPSWQERIGGRWAISLPAYLVGVAVNIVILALTGGQIGGQATSLDDALAWVLIGVVASACVGAYALAVNSSLFRNRRTIPVPAWAAIGFHSGVGLIFGTIVVVVGDAFVAPNPQSPILRITVITLIGLWWGLTASLVLEARDRFNREREALLDLAVALELASISEAETVSKLRTTIARQVEPSLGSTRELVDDVLAGFTPQNQTLLPIEQWWKISTSLRTAADSTIRPLSHQLWDATSQQYPRPRLGRVLSRFGLYQGFATWQSMIILGIGFLPAGLYDLGAVWGVLATVVMVGGIGLLMSLSNAILRLTRRAHLFVFASAFMLIEVVSLLFLALLQQFREGSITWNGEFIGAAIAVAVSVLMPAAYDSLTKERSEVIQKFRIDTNKAEITQRANALRLAQVTREAARELHGSVQTRLISCAIAIEQASRKGDVEQFKQALTTSIAILEAPLPSPENDDSHTVVEEVQRSCSPWVGLCEISTHIDPSVSELRGPVAMAAGRIVEEAIGNACRHGLADEVRISVASKEGSSMCLDIEDNGTGPLNGAPGVGTAMLVGISRGRVSLTARPEGGARLQVLIPMDIPA